MMPPSHQVAAPKWEGWDDKVWHLVKDIFDELSLQGPEQSGGRVFGRQQYETSMLKIGAYQHVQGNITWTRPHEISLGEW